MESIHSAKKKTLLKDVLLTTLDLRDAYFTCPYLPRTPGILEIPAEVRLAGECGKIISGTGSGPNLPKLAGRFTDPKALASKGECGETSCSRQKADGFPVCSR